MGKNKLIGGSLWEQYSQKVSDRMGNPRHRGEITEEEARTLGGKLVVADWGAESCGDAVRLYWAVDPATDRILLARFKSFGCGTAIASSDTMAELCVGKTVDEVVKITNIDVEHAMRDREDEPAIPPQKMHCSVMAYDVIKQAAAIYKGVDLTTLDQEDIVCECARVSRRTIEDVIRVNDLHTVEEITQFTKAGAFCKSCVQPGGHEKRNTYLVDILRETRQAMGREQIGKKSGTTDFSAMTPIQKGRVVEVVLEQKIRAMLAADGGGLEMVDLRDEGAETHVFIRYQGACQGCMSSTRGTLSAIEGILRQDVSDQIRVFPV